MTRQEKAKLTLRIAGAALIVWILPHLYLSIRQFVAMGFRPKDAPVLLWLLVDWPLLTALMGVVLLLLPGRVARQIFRGEEDRPLSQPEELLQIGIFLIGIVAVPAWVSLMLLALLAPPPQLGFLVSGVIFAAVAFWMLVFPGRLRKALSPRMAVAAESSRTPAPLLALGFLLLGLYFCTSKVSSIVGPVVVVLATRPPDDWAPGAFRHYLLAGIVSNGLALIAAFVLLLWAGPLASLLAGRANGQEEAEQTYAKPGPRTYFELALFVGVTYLFFRCLPHLVRSPIFAWQGTAALGALAHFVAAPAIAAALVFFLAGRLLPKIAGLLYPTEPGGVAAGHAMGEAAITILALYFSTDYLLHYHLIRQIAIAGSWQPQIYLFELARLLPGLASLGILAFRGDLAHLARRPKREEQVFSRRALARMLRPWLALLGMFLVLSDGPPALYWAGAKLLGLQPGAPGVPYLPRLGFVPGFVFILAAGTLSRWLSFGRLVPKIWPPPAK